MTESMQASGVTFRTPGVAGWLVLPAIGLVIGGIGTLLGILWGLAVFPQMVATGHGGLMAIAVLIDMGMLAFLIHTAKHFFKLRKDAPAMMIGLMTAGLVASGIVLLLAAGSGGVEMAAGCAANLVRSAVAASIWIPYFRTSRRVQATFVY